MRNTFLAFFLALAALVNAQTKETNQSPLGIPIYLSGTFAELRGNHFHGGLDIKTNGKQGYRVYAVDNGSISRVKVQEGGYGLALYIDHPNGYSSVYAHLKEFKGPIADYVYGQQYAQQKYAVDLYLMPGQFKVKKGEVIALSGNSGSSTAPHLHFEMRKSLGQIPVQPMEFIPIKDNINPTIQGIRAIGLSQGFYDATRDNGKIKYIKPGVYKIEGDTLRVSDIVVGLAIKAIDKQNGSNNSNGFYDLKLFLDDQLSYHYTKDEISFDITRHINAHIDYPGKKKGGGTYANCFRLPGNRLNIYKPGYNNGKIYLSQYPTRNVRIEICDYAGNTSTLNFVLKLEHGALNAVGGVAKFQYNTPNSYSTSGFSISVPNGALYDSFYFPYENLGMERLNGQKAFSDLHRIGDPEIPMQKGARISIEAKQIPSKLREKAFLAKLNSIGRISALSASWVGNSLEARTRDFGDYFITVDTTKPRAVVYNRPSADNYTGRETLVVKISDDLSGINTYRGEVDGQWILMAYDRKSTRLTHTFDEKIPAGKHILKVTVTDYVGNTKTLTYPFTK